MAVFREVPRCEKCGQPTAKAIYRTVGKDFIGDAFLGWEQIQHACPERFKKPTDDELIKFAILFNDGRIDAEELVGMVGMCNLVIDRLYENGDCMVPCKAEITTPCN